MSHWSRTKTRTCTRTSHDPTRSLYVSQPSSCVSCAGSYGSRRGRVWQITSSWSETTHRTTYDERHRHASSSFDRNVGIAHRGVCEREHVADEQGAAAQQAHGEAAGSRNVLWGGLLQDARGLRRISRQGDEEVTLLPSFTRSSPRGLI